MATLDGRTITINTGAGDQVLISAVAVAALARNAGMNATFTMIGGATFTETGTTSDETAGQIMKIATRSDRINY